MKKAKTAIYIPNMDADTFEKICLEKGLQFVYVEVAEHGRLIDADALRNAMYHEAFETDTPMQKWDSGCWIRYKMFERAEESAPTIIPADKEGKE